MNLRQLAKDSWWYLMGSLASRAVGLIMTPIYVRYLTTAEYGTVELLELCTQIATITLGIQAIGGSLLRIYYDYNDPESQAKTVSTAFVNTAIVGALLTGLAWLGAPQATHWLFHTSENTLWIRIAFLAMFLTNLIEVALVYQRLKDRVPFVVVYSLVQLVASLSLNIYFIVHLRAGVWGFILSKLITSAIGGAVVIGILLSETGFRWHREPSRRLTGFGFPLLLTGVATFAIHFSDRLFIDQYQGLQDVGLYSLAYKFAFLISTLVGEPFGRVWNVTLFASSATIGWTDQVSRALLYLMFALFFLGLGISIFAPQILLLVGGRPYAAAAPLIPILILGYVAREIGDFFRTVLYVNKRAYFVSGITISCAALNLALNFLLISRNGMVGAAWATLITWAVYMACCWFAALREFKTSFRLVSFVKICCAAFGIFWISKIAFTENTLVASLICASLMVLFCGVLLAVGYFSKGDREALTAAITRRLARAA